ncbi:MAG: DUF1343 domain-containing protein [Bacteroidales bacterium]
MEKKKKYNNLNYLVLSILCLIFLMHFNVSALYAKPSDEPLVKTGIEVLREHNFDILKGLRVGLITNATGVDHNLKSTVDILYEASNVNLVALYGPEHGIRGSEPAGHYVLYTKDKETGLPVFSLYGQTRKPSKLMLDGIDVLVYDIQDNGCRSYTFISTMGEVMEAAAENGIKVIVLDRPNPLTGLKIEGSIVEDGFYSFVSKYPIPYIYGMTCGELAEFINGEGLLKDERGKSLKCDLSVIRMEGWKRNMDFRDTGLPWVLTSPHIPSIVSSYCYPATGILGELGVYSIGVGYTLPFQIIGGKNIDAVTFAKRMNSRRLPGLNFRPIYFKPYYGLGKGTILGGVQIYIDDLSIAHLIDIQFIAIEELNKMYPDRDLYKMANTSRFNMYDKVLGTDYYRKVFGKNYRFDDIKMKLYKDVEPFRKLSSKYYLY